MDTNYVFRWELFINGFDAVEETGTWDKTKYGEMEAYCENILISMLMHFIAVDGQVTEQEVARLNSLFGFRFETDYVIHLCATMKEEMNAFFASPDEILSNIAAANTRIAEAFSVLLMDACKIITEIDGVTDEEKKELKNLIQFLSK